MSVARLKYDLRELKSLDKKLQDVASLANSPEIARKIAKALWANTLKRFVNKKDPEGNAWMPTKRGGSILVKSGKLQNFIVSDSDETEVVVGTNTKYAAIHQFGGEIKIPARKAKIYNSFNEKLNRFNNRGRFVKKRNSNFEREVSVGAYKITMPSRPYLGISAKDEEDISLIFSKMIEGLR